MAAWRAFARPVVRAERPPAAREEGHMVQSRDLVRLPFESSTPGIARTKLAAFLTRNRTDLAAIDNALIVLSEMIANAVAHGTPDQDGTMEIGWAIEEGHLLLSVRDSGHGVDMVPRPFDEDSL